MQCEVSIQYPDGSTFLVDRSRPTEQSVIEVVNVKWALPSTFMMMYSLRLKIANILVHNGVIRSKRICTDPQCLIFHKITALLKGHLEG